MPKGQKFGGRQKGTPNKDNPLKEYLKSHSMKYYAEKDEDGLTQWERDLAEMTPEARAAAEAKVLNKHVPDVKAIDANVSSNHVTFSIEDRLRELCGEDLDDDNDE